MIQFYVVKTGRNKQPFLQWKSRNYYIFFVCVCVLNLVIQRAMRMRHIVICGLGSSTVVFLIILQTAQLKKKVMNITGNCVQGQELSVYIPQEFIVHLVSSRKTIL